MSIHRKLFEARKNAAKLRDNFTIKDIVDPNSGERFSHEQVTKDIKDSFFKQAKPALWFTKQIITEPDDPFSPKQLAQREVVTQEFFRMMMPHHPKTRILLGDDSSVYVSSKGVPDFTSLEKIAEQTSKQQLHAEITSGRISGLGTIMVYSLFLNEVDLKLGNLGLDSQHRLVKIDGDWSFAAQRDDRKRNYDITPQVIESLPLVRTYDAMNWMDNKLGGVLKPEPVIITPHMSANPSIRAEINAAMLTVLVMPQPLIETFVHHYALDGKEAKNIITILLERKEALHASALKNDSFLHYLRSPEAAIQVKQMKELVNQFIPSGKHKLVENDTISDKIDTGFSNLQKQIPVPSPKPVTAEAKISTVLRK